MPNLGQRLARLEDAARPDGGVIIMWRYDDETNEQAVSRWKAEHPGEDPDAAVLKVIITRWLRSDEEPGAQYGDAGRAGHHTNQ